jgi:hypothetical protein
LNLIIIYIKERKFIVHKIADTSVPDGNYKMPQNRPPSMQPARPNSIEIDKQQNRQPRLTGNGHGNIMNNINILDVLFSE